jgi:hypothetical protein
MNENTAIHRPPGGVPTTVRDAFCAVPMSVPEITLRHWLTLERIGSPLVLGGPIEASNILEALLVVESPAHALQSWLDGSLTAEALLHIPEKHPNLPRAAAELQTRLRAALDPVPRDMPEDRDFHPPGVGWWLALLEYLMATHRMALDAALDTPLAVAFCLRAAAAEREGFPLPGVTYAERDLISALRAGPLAPEAASPASDAPATRDSAESTEEPSAAPPHIANQ